MSSKERKAEILTFEEFTQSFTDLRGSYVIDLKSHSTYRLHNYPFACMFNHEEDISFGFIVDKIDVPNRQVHMLPVKIRHTEERTLWKDKTINFWSGDIFPTLFSDIR